jgi:uncharacterized protein YecE (DUF72 family)
MTAVVRLGSCSWADRGLIAAWYPPTVRSAEARLRHYAEHFDTVEVNSSFYAVPDAATAARWADRTPDGFTFHVKAFGLMTGHRVTPEQLPPDLRDGVRHVDDRGFVEPDDALRERVFRRFRTALEPLRRAGRMGGVLMQFPPSFVPSEAARDVVRALPELLPEDEILVEFRRRGWLEDDRREATLALLEDLGLTYVAVDAPRVTSPNVVDTVVAATSATGYVRFHGRNAATWNASGSHSDQRFDHSYSEAELAEWVEPLRELTLATDTVYAMFNTNNGRQAPDNAALLRALLQRAEIPVATPPEPSERQETLF